MPNCELCGEPMPVGEEMFMFHGYSGPCPVTPAPRPAKPPSEAEVLRGLVVEFLDLCAIGDVDENTEAHGWGDLIKRAKDAVSDKKAGGDHGT